jgi:hypothetical protein
MYKLFCLLMLVISNTGNLFAQQGGSTNSDRIFDVSTDHIHRHFNIDLGKGNSLQIYVSDMTDIGLFSNMDSVLRVFLQDIAPLKDSLSDELTAKRIDYITDSIGRKKIRIQQFRPKGSSFLIDHGEASALKLEQDTVNFIGAVSYIAKFTLRKGFPNTREYQFSFFVNDLNDLASYTDGRLNKILLDLQKNINYYWSMNRNKGVYQYESSAVTARQPRGFRSGGDFLTLRFSVDAQNYKNYFVPAFSLGGGLIISHDEFKRDIALLWEPNFFFAKNAQGNLQTFRNDFLTLTFGQGPVRDYSPLKESTFITVISFGYLIRRQGDFIDKRSFRIGAGNISLFEGKTKIEPAFYFTDLFKHVTPSLRWIQSF